MSVRHLGYNRRVFDRIKGSSWKSAVLADSPWGLWMCDEPAGSTALADSSGNSRSMTVAGAPVFSRPGPNIMSAISWPLSSDYAVSGATSPASSVTMEAWFYLTGPPATPTPIMAMAVGGFGGGSYDKNFVIMTNGQLRFMIFTGSVKTPTSSVVPSYNAWHHVVASVGASGTKIRLDKTTVATDPSTGSYTGSQNLMLHGGAYDYRTGSSLLLGPCAFWQTQLSDTQTDIHYDSAS